MSSVSAFEHGRWCALRGWQRDACPHEERSHEGSRWLCGWFLGSFERERPGGQPSLGELFEFARSRAVPEDPPMPRALAILPRLPRRRPSHIFTVGDVAASHGFRV